MKRANIENNKINKITKNAFGKYGIFSQHAVLRKKLKNLKFHLGILKMYLDQNTFLLQLPYFHNSLQRN